MAGVISAFRNITSDRLWIIKVAVFSIPLFMYFHDKKAVLSVFVHDYIFFVALGLFYLGISSVLINRNINNKMPILPFIFDIYEIIIKTIGSVLAALPSLIIVCYILYFVENVVHLDNANVENIIKICTAVLMFPFICMPVVVFSVRGNILDVFKSFKIFFDCGRFIEHFLGYIIYSIIAIGLAAYLIYTGLEQYVGVEKIYVQILYSFLITLYVLMVFSWASDLYGDVIPEIEEKRKSIR